MFAWTCMADLFLIRMLMTGVTWRDAPFDLLYPRSEAHVCSGLALAAR
jgi:hypothetical protein